MWFKKNSKIIHHNQTFLEDELTGVKRLRVNGQILYSLNFTARPTANDNGCEELTIQCKFDWVIHPANRNCTCSCWGYPSAQIMFFSSCAAHLQFLIIHGVFMAALCSRAGHYIFTLRFLSSLWRPCIADADIIFLPCRTVACFRVSCYVPCCCVCCVFDLLLFGLQPVGTNVIPFIFD